MAELTSALEAILFASGESIPTARLSLVLGTDEEEILRCAAALAEEYEQNGMRLVGVNPTAHLVEIVEIPTLRWYIGTQFHPEYSSTVLRPHPLFMSFIKACSDGTVEA